MTLDAQSRSALEAASVGEGEEGDAGDVSGSLNVTFLEGDPDHRVEVPAVPG